MDILKYKRDYMKRKNATPEGAAYNRKKVQDWRRRQIPEKRRLCHGRRSIRGKNRLTELREAVVDFLVNRDGINCPYCRLPLDMNNLHLAHKLALALGGKNRLDNYFLAHPKCNQLDGIKVHRQVVCKD